MIFNFFTRTYSDAVFASFGIPKALPPEDINAFIVGDRVFEIDISLAFSTFEGNQHIKEKVFEFYSTMNYVPGNSLREILLNTRKALGCQDISYDYIDDTLRIKVVLSKAPFEYVFIELLKHKIIFDVNRKLYRQIALREPVRDVEWIKAVLEHEIGTTGYYGPGYIVLFKDAALIRNNKESYVLDKNLNTYPFEEGAVLKVGNRYFRIRNYDLIEDNVVV